MNLSIVNRAELRRQEVPLSQLATDAVARLREHEPKRAVEASIAPGLRRRRSRSATNCAREFAGQCVEIHRSNARAKIEVGSTGSNGLETFFVRDNGAGFDMAHADRLFGAFQRLHSEADFPGTGIGLATVRNMIARHGGQVWAQERNEGATICFTLPECAGG